MSAISEPDTRAFRSARELKSIPLPSNGDNPSIFLTDTTVDRFPNIENMISFFSHLLKFVGVPNCAVSSITIVDVDEISEWAHHIQKLSGVSQGITDNNSYVAVGKCIPYRWPDGSVSSSILLSCYLVLQVLSDFKVSKFDTLDFSINSTGQQALQVIVHELGHCRDYYERRPPELNRPTEYRFHTVREVGDWYGGIILEEFLACYYSTPVVTSEITQTCISNAIERAADAFEQAKSWEATRSVKVKDARIVGYVTQIQESVWLSLLAETESIAYGIRNCVPLDVGSAIRFPNLSDQDSSEIGIALLSVFIAILFIYPSVPYHSTINALVKIWKSLCYRLNIMTETEWINKR